MEDDRQKGKIVDRGVVKVSSSSAVPARSVSVPRVAALLEQWLSQRPIEIKCSAVSIIHHCNFTKYHDVIKMPTK
jgi:hypothetical protein